MTSPTAAHDRIDAWAARRRVVFLTDFSRSPDTVHAAARHTARRIVPALAPAADAFRAIGHAAERAGRAFRETGR